jgi:P-type conjugative transfer protein TrbJ
MLAIRQPLDAAGALDLARRYPILAQAYAKRDAESMRLLRQQWLDAERKELIQAQTLHNRVVNEMPNTQSRVAEIVRRSNSAPGQTAVLQASNEMLATLAGQLQALQALEVSETRIELEENARRQAEVAFQEQRRAALMRNWPVSASQKSSSTGSLLAKKEGK